VNMIEERPLHVLGISGSLRVDSYNTALLRAAAELLPPGMTLEITDLAGIPLFNQDEENPFPEEVARLRARIAAADALLFATPEYNSSISGVLKNALDWASRAPDMPLAGKPAALMGASTGVFGTARAQLHLRQVLAHLGALVLTKPEVMVMRAADAFDEQGRLVNEVTRGFLGQLLVELAQWTRLVSAR
ncbi:MAG TPA: NAD(P)H-dependent oxidoreductase, partial [Anaerolineaceae bacterium]|nr:NAD(P)H-dependent oxidoreductase [Anaerolineaceae bacterium]